MNKVKTLKLNLITSIIPWSILALIGFIKIKFFIAAYGSELNGFVQVVTQIYGYLSLVEMGFGSAILFKLYKPLAENDILQVTKLFNGCKKIYRNIALQLGGLTLITAFIIPVITQSETMSNTELVVIFLIYGVDYFAKYIFDLPYRALLYADQKKYRANIIINAGMILIKSFEIVLILLKINYFILLSVIVISDIMFYIIFNRIAKKSYPYLNMTKEADVTSKEMSKDVMGHKLSRIVMYGSASIVISTIPGLGLVGSSIYASYNYIVSALREVTHMLFGSSPLELIGNKMAKDGGNKKENTKLFDEFMSASYVIGVIISSVFFASVGKLIEIWISPEYVLGAITILFFAIYVWQECMGRAILTMVEAIGKYKETKRVEIITAALTLILSFVFGYLWGITGVVIAPVLIIMFIRQPLETKFIYNEVLGVSMKKQLICSIIYTIIMLAFCWINVNIINLLGLYSEPSYINWIISSAILTIIVSVIIVVPAFFIDKSFNGIVKRVIGRK